LLTGEEIVTALGKHIIIYPFDRQALAGTTYNLRVGRFAWLHDPSPTGLPIEPSTDGRGNLTFVIPPGTVISVLTEEAIYLDSLMGGLVHSRVGLVSRGFSHVSTIVDPTWIGPLLITFQNCSRTPQPLRIGEALVKLTFHRLARATSIEHDNRQPGRGDWISRMGFHFPEGDEDYLTKPVNCKLGALREAFLSSKAGVERVTWRARSTQRRWRLALIAVATLGLVLAATSFWWLPAIFHTELGDEALVGLVAIVASAATYLTAQLMRR